MNLYGFAGGDPVNFSDPFGLCPVDKPLCQWMLAASVAAGADLGGMFGGGAGLLTGPGAVVATPAGAMAGAALGGGAGLAVGKLLTDRLFSESSSDASGSGGESKANLEKQPGETGNFNYAVKKLGLDKTQASKELHAIKKANEMRGDENVWINYHNGNVRSQVSGELIGNIVP